MCSLWNFFIKHEIFSQISLLCYLSSDVTDGESFIDKEMCSCSEKDKEKVNDENQEIVSNMNVNQKLLIRDV